MSAERSPRVPGLARGQERLPEHRRGRPLLGREVDVPRGHREPVRLADGRVCDDLGRQREVARHLANDQQLLGVLLPEVRPLGADEREQDRHDRGDTVEVARPGGTFEGPGHVADMDGRVEARRVDLLDRRREDEVDALLGADRQVARLAARVLLEVRRVAELARVDEDRDDGRAVLLASPAISARWPSCSQPIVGTSPTGRGAASRASRSSLRERTIRRTPAER